MTGWATTRTQTLPTESMKKETEAKSGFRFKLWTCVSKNGGGGLLKRNTPPTLEELFPTRLLFTEPNHGKRVHMHCARLLAPHQWIPWWITFLAEYFNVEEKDDKGTRTIKNDFQSTLSLYCCSPNTIQNCKTSRQEQALLTSAANTRLRKSLMLRYVRIGGLEWGLIKRTWKFRILKRSQFTMQCSWLLRGMKPKFKKPRVTEPLNKNTRWRWNQLDDFTQVKEPCKTIWNTKEPFQYNEPQLPEMFLCFKHPTI